MSMKSQFFDDDRQSLFLFDRYLDYFEYEKKPFTNLHRLPIIEICSNGFFFPLIKFPFSLVCRMPTVGNFTK